MSYKMNEHPYNPHSGQEIKFAATSEAILIPHTHVIKLTSFLLIPYFSLQFICRVRHTYMTWIFVSQSIFGDCQYKAQVSMFFYPWYLLHSGSDETIVITCRFYSSGRTVGNGACLQWKAFDGWLSHFWDVSRH